MKTRIALLLLVSQWFALATTNVYAQTHRGSPVKNGEKNFMQAGLGFQGGVWVTVTTYAVLPDGTKEHGDVAGGIAAGNERVIHRHIETNNACYGYDLAIEPPKDASLPRFQISFRPLDPEWQKKENERILASNKKACTLVSLSELPEPQMVANADTISLEILSNPQTGVRIVDAIKVGWERDTSKPEKENIIQPKTSQQ
jgi:hypothetical protein